MKDGAGAVCISCGENLSLIERVGEDICRRCAQERHERWKLERESWRSVTDKLAAAPSAAACDEAIALQRAATLSSDEKAELAAQSVRALARSLIRDDLLSGTDQAAIFSFANHLGLGPSWDSSWLTSDADLSAQLQIAAANMGRLPSNSSEYLMNPQSGEVVHYMVKGAALMRIGREYLRTYQGLSLPIGQTRARYHFGSSRGRVVSTGWERDDEGPFLITSHRTIFMGRENSKIVPYGRLLDIRAFTDGLAFYRDDRV